MKLWLIRQDVNNGYDTYDSAVVAAETEDAARRADPGNWLTWSDKRECWLTKNPQTGLWEEEENDTWANDIAQVNVTLLGEAEPNTPAQVICASFNAG